MKIYSHIFIEINLYIFIYIYIKKYIYIFYLFIHISVTYLNFCKLSLRNKRIAIIGFKYDILYQTIVDYGLARQTQSLISITATSVQYGVIK